MECVLCHYRFSEGVRGILKVLSESCLSFCLIGTSSYDSRLLVAAHKRSALVSSVTSASSLRLRERERER